MADGHHWRAQYDDGSHLDEHDADGRGVGFASVDQSRLVALELLPQSGGIPYRLQLGEGMRPIFFRRRAVTVNPSDGVPEDERVIDRKTSTVIGWQRTVEGRNVKSLVVLLPDGSVLLTDDDAAF